MNNYDVPVWVLWKTVKHYSWWMFICPVRTSFHFTSKTVKWHFATVLSQTDNYGVYVDITKRNFSQSLSTNYIAKLFLLQRQYTPAHQPSPNKQTL